MSLRLNQILIIAFILFCTGANAQVFIGDGVSIGANTQITIVEKDVIIATEEIQGEGELNLINSSTLNITVSENFKTNVDLHILSPNVQIEGNYAEKFAAQYLPFLTEEIIASTQDNEVQEDLPVRYINTEGKVFPVDKEEEKDVVINSLSKDVESETIMSEILRIKLANLQTDYIIPIYSNRFNDQRNSDSAELYEFECLTAILKPPIV